jgi:hypothetical protein
MKKTIILSAMALVSLSFLASCSKQTDCTCTYSATKTKTASGSATTPVYDWGGSCSDIKASDINLGSNYNVNCSEM